MKPAGAPAERRRAIVMLLVVTLVWGLSFPLIKTLALMEPGLVPGAGGAFLVAGITAPRFLLAAPILALWLLMGRRRRADATPLVRRTEWFQGLAVGGFATAGMLLQNDGLRFTAASTSAFLTNFYAILIPIWVALRRRRLPAFRIWISCILVTAGIAILGRFDWTAWRFGRGEAETLLASGFFMVQILWLEHPAYADNRPMPMTLVMFGVEAVGFGALGLATAPRLSAMLAPWLSPAWVGCTLLLTVGCTLFSFTLMNIWQPKITATEAGLVYCAEPLFGSVLSLFLPALFSVWAAIHYANERVTLNLLWGGGLITAANVLIQLQPRAPAGRCESTAPPAG